jgi:type VI secretion system VasD/TssJ family lipoprotein
MVRLNHLRGAVVASALAAACGGTAAPPPAAPAKPCQALPLSLALTATARSNALSTGEGRPVQLHVYQLKTDARLRTASFEDIWQNDAKTLEGELVSSEQHTIFPGEKKTITVAPKPDAAYLAVVALFREPQGKDWFLTYEIAPPKSQPPCESKATPIPIWLDRMQIQDGAGRENEGDAEAGSGSPEPAKDDGVKGF